MDLLNGSAFVSKLDLEWGYHQIELEKESRVIQTFSTHLGLHRFKRLMFGINCAPYMYHRFISQTLQLFR